MFYNDCTHQNPTELEAKSCFSDWSITGKLLLGIKKKESVIILVKHVFCKLKRHRTPNFAQVLHKFPLAFVIIIMKLSFPIFFITKRCSIICANFNISPLEIIVSIILNYLNGGNTTKQETLKQEKKKVSKGKKN